MNRVVLAGERAADRGQRQQRVERNLRQRRTDLDAAQQGRACAAKHTQARPRPRLSEWIRHEIDVMAERRERANAMELAERRAARLEERLRRDHQNAHGSGDFLTDRWYSDGSSDSRACTRTHPDLPLRAAIS